MSRVAEAVGNLCKSADLRVTLQRLRMLQLEVALGSSSPEIRQAFGSVCNTCCSECCHLPRCSRIARDATAGSKMPKEDSNAWAELVLMQSLGRQA